jgi:hypothetical protein
VEVLTQNPSEKAGLACHAHKAGSTSYFEFTFWAFQYKISLIKHNKSHIFATIVTVFLRRKIES